MVWRSQPVWMGANKWERSVFIKEFAASVRKWMKTLGYTMEHRLEKELSLWLYRIYVQEIANKKYGQFNPDPVYLPEPEHRDMEEDYDQYNMVVDHHEVSKLMSEWSMAQDMDVNSIIGKRVWYGLQEFLYNVINLESSKQGRLIARLWDSSNSNSDNEFDYKKDIYIEEAAKGLHGGRGSKV